VKVFVTGGNGFIGSRVVRLLHQRGYEVRCLLRATSDTRRIRDIPFEEATGDVRDPACVERGFRGTGACIHLAGPSSWAEIASDEVEPVILGGARAVLAAAEKDGVRLVYVSTAAAVNGSKQPTIFDETADFMLGKSGLRYAVAKHQAEGLVADAVERGLDAVVVNPTETYGPDDHEWVTAGALRDALRTWPALAVQGGTSVAHVEDVAEGIVAALEKGRAGQRYILGGENLTVREILRTAVEAAGSRRPVVLLPEWLVRAVSRACMALHVSPPILPDLIGYATRFWFMDCTKARRELGYRSRPAAETIRSVVAWIQQSELEPVRA
jgi:dihydroflavonol-4-reductase